MINKSKKSLTMFGVLSLICGTLTFLHCGSDKDALNFPGGGLISISGQPVQPLVLSNVAIAVSGSTTTLTLSSNFSTQFGQFVTRAIKFTIPTSTFPSVGVPIQLTNTSTLIETTTLSSGAVISTNFSSTKAKGVIFFNSFAPNSAVGSYQAVFADAAGRTRAIFNGTFSFTN